MNHIKFILMIFVLGSTLTNLGCQRKTEKLIEDHMDRYWKEKGQAQVEANVKKIMLEMINEETPTNSMQHKKN